MRLVRHGDPDILLRGNPETVWVKKDGSRYRRLNGHPLSDKQGRIAEHRLVLFSKIGEPPHRCHFCLTELISWVQLTVAHLDGDKGNNNPSNLVSSCHSCGVQHQLRENLQQTSVCAECEGNFSKKQTTQIYCSEKCKRRSGWKSKKKTPERTKVKNERNKLLRSPIFIRICERDQWKCHICGLKVDPKFRWPDPFSASRDHIIPIVEGGGHTPENIRLAHLRCNVSRGHRGGNEQLLLIG